jgi:protocatechuate 3,4-dioxygenase beta subunit
MLYLSLQVLLLSFSGALCSNDFQDTAKQISQVSQQLKSGITVDEILQDTNLMSLHPDEKFRSLIKKFSASGELNMISPSEPGQRINVIVFMKDKKGNPLPDALVYFYQTDDRGFYGTNTTHVTGNEGDRRHARIFGYAHSDNEGRVVLHTIHPRGYPGSVLPSHIHCEVFAGGSDAKITELLFDEDSRLTPEQRARSQSEGFIIAKNNRNRYEYLLVVNQ